MTAKLIMIEGVTYELRRHRKPKKRKLSPRDANWHGKRRKPKAPPPVAPGMTFGDLTVLEQAITRRYHPIAKYWRCMCVCGTSLVVRQFLLLDGRKRSCGLGHRYHAPPRPAIAGQVQPAEQTNPEPQDPSD